MAISSRSSRVVLPLSPLLHPVWLASLASLAALPLACGGRAGAADCPPGYTCMPACPPGDICTPNGYGSPPYGGPGSPGSGGGNYDAGGGPYGDAATLGAGGDYPEGSVPPASSEITVLDYRVVDAAYSAPLATVVAVTDSPANALHLWNTKTKDDKSITLPLAPVAVAVDATGAFAAVAHNAHVSWIDLNAGTVKATCDLTSDAYDIALSTKGIAYVMPRTDQWVAIHVVDLVACKEISGGDFGGVYASGSVALHPSEKALFVADQGLSPSSINRCDVTKTPVPCTDAMNGGDWGEHAYCGKVWGSADGARLYSGCGVTLKVPGDVNASQLSYGGTLADVTLIQDLSEAPQAKEVVLIPGSNNYGWNDPSQPTTVADTVLRIHETDYLGFVKQVELPRFPLKAGASALAHGKFVFATASADALYAVVQADASSGALHDFAIAKVIP